MFVKDTQETEECRGGDGRGREAGEGLLFRKILQRPGPLASCNCREGVGNVVILLGNLDENSMVTDTDNRRLSGARTWTFVSWI
jgi:hypothetical protein